MRIATSQKQRVSGTRNNPGKLVLARLDLLSIKLKLTLSAYPVVELEATIWAHIIS
jgi:hypothetical protein